VFPLNTAFKPSVAPLDSAGAGAGAYVGFGAIYLIEDLICEILFLDFIALPLKSSSLLQFSIEQT